MHRILIAVGGAEAAPAERNPSRNSRLELIDADEGRDCAMDTAPGFAVPHEIDRSPMPWTLKNSCNQLPRGSIRLSDCPYPPQRGDSLRLRVLALARPD